ncbi:MAG: hypothetical protein GX432_06360 [Candidatus Atribacteria bacterium]|nr:hypothetical protein [Candidatus Atribacteria bacterium]
MENTREAFSGKSEKKDGLEDVFDWKSFLFVYLTFPKQLVQFELLHKRRKH